MIFVAGAILSKGRVGFYINREQQQNRSARWEPPEVIAYGLCTKLLRVCSGAAPLGIGKLGGEGAALARKQVGAACVERMSHPRRLVG